MNSMITRLGLLTCSALTGPAGSQLARVAAVGAAGYQVNLTVFTLIRHATGDSLLPSASDLSIDQEDRCPVTASAAGSPR